MGKRKLPGTIVKADTTFKTNQAKSNQSDLMSYFVPEGSPEPEEEIPAIEWQKYTINGVPIKFPFRAYPSQIQMMSKIIQAIKASENALLESPTGTGKTLTILTSALAWREQEKLNQAETLKARREVILEAFKESQRAARECMPVTSPYFQDVVPDQSKDSPVLSCAETCGEPMQSQIPLLTSQTPLVIGYEDKVSYENDDDFMPLKSRRAKEPVPLIVPLMESIQEKNESLKLDEGKIEPLKLEPLPEVPKVFILSRTQKQLKQMIHELRTKTPYRPKMAVLGSRKHYCVNKDVKNEANIDEKCESLRDSRSCRFHERFYAVTSHQSVAPDHEHAIWDIEDLVRLGTKVGGCPYYASREMAKTADVIFAPYNYLIDPAIRGSCEVPLDGNIVIIDESHNLEGVACEAGSLELNEVNVLGASKYLEGILAVLRIGKEPYELMKGLLDSLITLRRNMDKNYTDTNYDTSSRYWKGPHILQALDSVQINKVSFGIYQASMATIKEDHAPPKRPDGNLLNPGTMNVLKSLMQLFSFLFDEKQFAADYILALTKKKIMARDGQRVEFSFSFVCLNPGVVFNQISSLTRSIILASGTLCPLTTFAGELGTSFPHRIEAPHVIGPDQLWVGTIGRGPDGSTLLGTYKSFETWAYQDGLGKTILGICQLAPQGTLVFLPAYSWLEKLTTRWRQTGLWTRLEANRKVFAEPRSSKKEDLEELMADYEDAISKGPALLFCVYRGKLSEGIDFSDSKARAVICVGIPFPSLYDFKVKQKRDYNDANAVKKHLLPGNQWYETQAYRALNQALGRCIRHKDDWGAIVLVDQRYSDHRTQGHLTKWIRNSVQTFHGFESTSQSLSSFFTKRQAIDQARDLENEYSKSKSNLSTDSPTKSQEEPRTPMEAKSLNTSVRQFSLAYDD